jgi:hypothetical protein
MQLGERQARLVDHLQRLGADNAVERVGSDCIGAGQVGHDGRLRTRDGMEDVAPRHARAPTRRSNAGERRKKPRPSS